MTQHQPVLLQEVIDSLAIIEDGIYVDGTFGRGGHTREILSQLGSGGRVIAFDKDPQAVRIAEELCQQDPRLEFIQGSFTQMDEAVRARGLQGKVNGIFLDLGVSSPQLDQAERGFSFMREGPLDMRMDPTSGISAADWLATASDKDIVRVLKKYGEERYAKRIARGIIEQRQQQPITTTTQLAELITRVAPTKERHKHPATRTFQALRIFINQELAELETVLPQTINVLANKGRLVVISFHSLEDRIVKRFMHAQANPDIPRDLPIKHANIVPIFKRCGRAVRASDEEISNNPRARSAIMRVAERIK